MEAAMAERRNREVSAHILTALGLKRIGAPQPISDRTFLGTADEGTPRADVQPKYQPMHVGWRFLTRWGTYASVDDAGLRQLRERERVEREQELEVIREGVREALASAAVTKTNPTDKPFAGVKSTIKNVAGALRYIWPPDGVPDVGWKKAEPRLLAVGMATRCSTFNCAVKLNKEERRRLRIVSS
jgi:hypothetical protein